MPGNAYRPPSPAEMAGMSWDQLYDNRLRAGDDNQYAQNILAPYEHRAWAREQVASNPALAPVYGVIIPGYEAYKAIKQPFSQEWSDPSLSSISQGYQGVVEGLQQSKPAVQALIRGLLDRF